jgi:hypothetical protein
MTNTAMMEQAQRSLKRVIEEYEGMQEDLALLSNPEHIDRIAYARAAYTAGESIVFEDYVNNRPAR